MLSRMLRVCICLLLPALAGNAPAATTYIITNWTGGAGTSDWLTVGNWSNGVPDNIDHDPGIDKLYYRAVIALDPSHPTNPVISTPGAQAFNMVIADNTASGLTINPGGDLNQGWGTILGGNWAPTAPGTFNNYGGTWTGAQFYVGDMGPGTLNMTGGTMTVKKALRMGWDGGAGTLNLEGGTITVNYPVIPDEDGLCWYGGSPGTGTGTINIYGGLLVLGGDKTADVETWIGGGRITSCGILGYDYDVTNPGATSIYRTDGPVPNPFPGDTNKDGDVDEDDAAMLAANWLLASGGNWYKGDFNGDGIVDDKDATLMATNWGKGSPAVSVPEPSVLMLICAAVAMLLLRRRIG